ncbi:hypothetical protein Tco_1235597 [Tanacetum coccineum]
MTNSETKSDKKAFKINARNQEEGQAGPNHGLQDEGQARPNPGVQYEGQAGPNHGIAAESQLQSSHVVHARPNLEHIDLGTFDALTQQKPKQMDEKFIITAYPNVQENLKLPTEDQKPQEEEPGKTNAEAEVLSIVSVPIHQDTSSVPPMTTPIIDLTTMQSDSPLPTSTTTTSIITTTTSLPPPPQPQQITTYPILVSRIGELEQHMADLIQNNLALEERDLPTVDMKEILPQRMFEDDSYKAYTVQSDLYVALQKSLELYYSNQRLADQKEARKKRQMRRDVPRTPPGSPPLQPLLPPPPEGASGALGTLGESRSSYLPPPPPPSSTSTSGSAQQQGHKAPSLSKTAASASQSMA